MPAVPVGLKNLSVRYPVSRLFCTALILIFLSADFLVAETESRKLNVGISLPLTGSLAEYGAAVKNGIDLAKEELEGSLGSVNFIYDDNQYNPKIAVTSFNKLSRIDKVKLVYVWGVEPSLSIAPVAEANKIPTLLACQEPSVSRGRKFAIRFMNPGEHYAEELVRYFTVSGIKKIGIVKTEASYFNVLLDQILRELDADQTVTVIDTFLGDQYDFRSTVTKLKKQEYDSIGVLLFANQVNEFYKQAHDQNFKFNGFGGTPFESRDQLKKVLPLLDGAIYVHNFVEEDFHKRYLERFKNDVHIAYAANSYQFAVLVADAVRELGTDIGSPNYLLNFFNRERSGEGVSGPYKVKQTEKDGTFYDFQIAVKQIEGNGIKTLATRSL